ncbi:MAG TPA: YbhB/YbcL family Raf kinase inhibitor-like protein [Solirubrobacteraceae bacterium]|nr:YbhB/YbcL family Raf kinase inhibitor-like protein [Solirubrobacteraceae bacterium]
MRRLGLAVVVVGLTACGGSGPGRVARIPVTSAAFGPSGQIPKAYTCDGEDISPPLHWSDVPTDATQLSLLMQDPDAPGGNFIHWQIAGLSPRSSGIGAGQAPAIGNPGTNSFGTTGYRGPCPPRGSKRHHFVITITAQAADQTVAVGTLTGTYSRG